MPNRHEPPRRLNSSAMYYTLFECHPKALLLQCVSHVTVKQLTVDMSLLLQNFSFSVCATKIQTNV